MIYHTFEFPVLTKKNFQTIQPHISLHCSEMHPQVTREEWEWHEEEVCGLKYYKISWAFSLL